MDYTIFAKEHHNVTMLMKKEIDYPVTGLKEFLIGKSPDQLKRNVQDLLIAVFEDDGWRRHGAPIVLYSKIMDVAKLIDFVWLIIVSSLSIKKSADVYAYYLNKQYRYRTFGKLFYNTPSKNKAKTVSSVLLSKSIFAERFGLLVKEVLAEDWLEVALNSSYMRNLNAEFHNIECTTQVKEYRYFMDIIDAAFEIADQSEMALDREILAYYQLFAVDVDHPDALFKDGIEMPLDCFEGPLFYVDINRLPKAMRTWFSLTYKTDHWKDHNDPGNLLYLRQTVQRFLDTGWLFQRVGFPNLKKQRPKKGYMSALSLAEIADPVSVIEHFFEQRRLHEWKQLLETWLCQSLSNDFQRGDVSEKDCGEIIKLTQALKLVVDCAE